MFVRLCSLVTAGAALVALAAGCGPDYKARGSVKGVVKSPRGTLTAGTVMFFNASGMNSSAPINSKGEYNMPDAPLGECTITVTVPEMPMDPNIKARMQGKEKGPKMPVMNNPDSPDFPMKPDVPTKIVPIDQKYSKPETSGLKYTVQKGEQVHNIDL